jgi:hypothetical protein
MQVARAIFPKAPKDWLTGMAMLPGGVLGIPRPRSSFREDLPHRLRMLAGCRLVSPGTGGSHPLDVATSSAPQESPDSRDRFACGQSG